MPSLKLQILNRGLQAGKSKEEIVAAIENAKRQGFDLSTGERISTTRAPQPTPPTPEVPKEEEGIFTRAIKATPASAGRFVGDIARAVTSPIETGKAVSKTLFGAG